MSTADYDGMSLDDLLAISRSDAEHAGDMAEQARVLREMSGLLQDKVDLMRDAMATLFGSDPDTDDSATTADAAWQGSSSSMMKTELDRLYTMASAAPEVLNDNAGAMDNFSTQAHQTLITVDQLHVEAADNARIAGSTDARTTAARTVVSEANAGYLAEAEAMRRTPFYPGLREAAPDDGGGDWTDRHGAYPGTDLHPVTSRAPGDTVPPSEGTAPTGPTDPDGGTTPWPPSGHGPQLQNPGFGPVQPSPAPAPAPITPVPPVTGPPAGPVPVSPFPPPSRPVTPPVIGRPPAPVPTRPPLPNPGRPANPTPPVLRPAPRPTVPPVIGGRPPATTVPAPHRPLPEPGAPVRPVIGSRPPTTTPVPMRPSPDPTGTVRPVIGSRPVTGGYVPRPVPGTGTVTSRPPGGSPVISRPVIGPGGVRGSVGPMGVVRPVITGPVRAVGVTGPRTGTVPAGSRTTGSVRTGSSVRAVIARPTVLPEYPDGLAPAPRPTSGALAADPRAVSPGGARVRATTVEPEPVPRRTPEPEPAPKPATRLPGQRVKRIVRGGRATAERAVIRGVRRQPASQRPGQEVFAKFAARKAEQATEASRSEPVTDADELWLSARSTVRPVITGRSTRSS